jgi:hypothetical protein
MVRQLGTDILVPQKLPTSLGIVSAAGEALVMATKRQSLVTHSSATSRMSDGFFDERKIEV